MSDGSVVIDVELNTGKAKEQYGDFGKELSGDFNEVNRSSGRARRGILDMAKAMGVVKLASKALSLVNDSLDGAIRRYDTLNNADRVFENMGFEASVAERTIDELSKSLRGLPTPLDMAIRNVQLLAAATNDLELSEQVFSAMNNAILGFGGSAADVDRAVVQLSQAFSNGTIDAQTWNSMINANLGPTLNALAREMGKTTGQLKSELSEGTISVEEFQDALIDLNKNGGGGLASLETIARDATGGISTSMDNMRTAIVRGLERIIRTFDDTMRGFNLPTIGEMITAFGEQFESALDIVSDKMPTIIRLTQDLYNILVVLEPVLWGIAGAIAAIKVQLAVGAIMKFVAPLISALGMIPGIFGAISADLAMGHSLFSILAANIKTLGGALVAALGGPVTVIIGLVGALIGILTYLWFRTDWFRELVISAWDAIKSAISTSIDFIVSSIRSFAEYIGELLNINLGLRDKLSNIWQGIQNIISNVLQFLGGLVELFGEVSSSVFESTLSVLSSIAETIVNIIGYALDLMSSLGEAISSAFGGALELMLSAGESMSGAFSTLLEVISSLIESVGQLWETFKESAFVEGLISLIGLALEFVGNKVSDVIDAFSALINDFDFEPLLGQAMLLIPKLVAIFLSKPVGLALAGANIIKMIADGMGMTVPELFEMVTDIIVGAIEQFSKALPMYVQIGVDTLTALIEGFTEAIPMVTEVIVDVIVMIVETLLSGVILILETGVQLLVALIDGIVGALPIVLDAAISIVFALLDGIISLLPVIIEAGVGLLGALIGGLLAMLPGIIEIALVLVTTLLDAIISMLPAVIETAITLLTTLLDTIISLLPVIIETAITLVMTLLDAIIDLLPVVIETAITLVMTLIDAIIDLLPFVIETAITLTMTLIDTIIELIPVIIDAGIQLVLSLIEGLISLIPALLEAAFDLVMALVNAIIDLLPVILQAGVDILYALIEGIILVVPALLKAIYDIIVALVKAIIDMYPQLWNSGIDLINSLRDGMQTMFNSVVLAIIDLVTRLLVEIAKFIGRMFNAGVDLLESLGNGVKSMFSSIWSFVVELGTGIVQRVSDINLFEAGRSILSSLWDGMTSRWESVSSWVGGLGDQIKNLKGPIEVDRVLLVDEGNAIMDSLRNGLGGGFIKVENQVRKMAGAIQKAFGEETDPLPFDDFFGNQDPTVKVRVDLDEDSANDAIQYLQNLFNKVPGLEALLNGTLTPEMANGINRRMNADSRNIGDTYITNHSSAQSNRDDLDNLISTLENLSIVLEDGTLVGKLAPGLSKEINRMNGRRKRNKGVI